MGMDQGLELLDVGPARSRFYARVSVWLVCMDLVYYLDKATSELKILVV